jgi:hypothetical protein
MSDENPILRIDPSSVPGCDSLSLVDACMHVFVTSIMTGEGVQVSKALAVEQHPNVRLWRALPSAQQVHLCVCVRTCERRDERRKQRQ